MHFHRADSLRLFSCLVLLNGLRSSHSSWWVLMMTNISSSSAQSTTSFTLAKYSGLTVIVEAFDSCSVQRTGMRMALKPASFTAWIMAFVVLGFPHPVSPPLLSNELPRFHPIFTCRVHSFPVKVMPDGSGVTVCACKAADISKAHKVNSFFICLFLVFSFLGKGMVFF